MSFNHRLQLLLDEERFERVAAAAREQRISVAAVIRDAIDHSLAPVDRKRSQAARAVLAAPAMEVPEGDGLVAELDELRARQ